MTSLFWGEGGGQPKSDEKWSGGGGVSALFSKAKVTSFLDGPYLLFLFLVSFTWIVGLLSYGPNIDQNLP